jgi:hypothetical protein
MTPHSPQKPPKSLRTIILLASSLAGLATAAALYLAMTAAAQVLWAASGFLVVMLIAAALGILAGLGRFVVGYGLATLSIAGTLAGGGLFAWRDLASNLGRDAQIGPLLLPWLGGMAAIALVITLAGAAAVLTRRPHSWGVIGKALACLIPAALLLAAGYFGWSRTPSEDAGRAIALAVLLLGGAIIGTLVSIGGHLLIRAFEMTAEDPNIARS